MANKKIKILLKDKGLILKVESGILTVSETEADYRTLELPPDLFHMFLKYLITNNLIYVPRLVYKTNGKSITKINQEIYSNHFADEDDPVIKFREKESKKEEDKVRLKTIQEIWFKPI